MKTALHLLIGFLALFSVPLFFSCNHTITNEKERMFLDVYEPLDRPLTPSSYFVLSKALERMNCYVKDGLIVSNVCSASEINVSDQVFNYLVKSIEKANALPYKPTLPTKSDPPQNYACVAHTLSNIDGANSFEEIYEWICDKYHLNGGVPTQKIGEVIVNHMTGTVLGYPPTDFPTDDAWSANTSFGVYMSGDGWGHMVNIVSRYSNGDFCVMDYSADTVGVMYNVFNCYMLYTWRRYAPADTTGTDIVEE